MNMNRYFECANCGQVVQGFEASRQVDCCDRPDYQEIDGPEVLDDPAMFIGPDGAYRLRNGKKHFVEPII